MSEKESFWNRKLGGLPLAMLMIVLYVSFKFNNTDLSPTSVWYSMWFIAIIINALTSDLFENTSSWVFTSMQKLENAELSQDEKIKFIQAQLNIAVNRYTSVFMAVNNTGSIKNQLTSMLKGKITIKELLIIFLYAMYDLVLRGADLSFMEPWDILVVFTILMSLKIVDASSGFASVVAEMYIEAFGKENPDLEVLTSFIHQLCQKFQIEISGE